jgi:hypothetical protein
MPVELQVEQSTYYLLKEHAEPFETLDQLLVRLIKPSRGRRVTPIYKGPKIGRAIKSMIRKGATNQAIFDVVTIDFPNTRIKTPGEISHYRSVMKKEARDKRKAKKR